MTFNTGNPIGSTDARDLSDNAENFDKALGTLDATWTDRLGVTRDSFEGRLAKGSFYRVGDFTTGYTLTNMRQTLEYSGHEYSWAGTFPKVVAARSAPATSGGIGAGAWVDRTDVTLRNDINIVQKLFTCVADMVSDTSLTVGKIVETIGYYNDWVATSAKPKGGNKYEIVATATGTADGGSFITLSNGLQAKGLFDNWVVDVYQFGAKGDGVADDTISVDTSFNYAINNNLSVDCKSGIYRMTSNLSFSIANKNFRLLGIKAKFIYSTLSHTKYFIEFGLENSCIYVERGIEFDADSNSNIVVSINSNDITYSSSISNVYFYGVVRNAYRIRDFTGGAGLSVTGGYQNVLFEGMAYDSVAANGAIIPGSQAIRGVLISANAADKYPVSIVIGDTAVISGVRSEDTSIVSDQDGVYVVHPLVSNTDTTFVIKDGATFIGCRGRCVKAKVDNAVVGGLYIIDEGNDSNNVQSVVDLQYGGVYKNCIVRCKGVAPEVIFQSGGLEYTSSVRSTETVIRDCYITSDVPLPIIIESFPRTAYVGDMKIRDVSVRADVSTFFNALVNGANRSDSISGVTIDNLTSELVRCAASGGDTPYAAVFNIKDCTNKTPISAPLVVRSGIAGVSADGWANAENINGFAPSTRAFRRLSGTGETVPYGSVMSPVLAQVVRDGATSHKADSGAFFGETYSLTLDEEFTFTPRGRGTSAQGIYSLTVSNIIGMDYMDVVAITGTTITSVASASIGAAFVYGSGADPLVANKINIWVDSATGAIKVISRQGGTPRVLTMWSMT